MTIKEHAKKRYDLGVEKKGEINLETDKRNFVTEALEELVDAHNYVTWAKIPKLAKRFILLILGMMYDILLSYENGN